jgi:hypothetical protein
MTRRGQTESRDEGETLLSDGGAPGRGIDNDSDTGAIELEPRRKRTRRK